MTSQKLTPLELEEMMRAIIEDDGSGRRGRCKDGGKCHHDCREGCFREKYCSPLPGSDFNPDWTPKEEPGK